VHVQQHAIRSNQIHLFALKTGYKSVSSHSFTDTEMLFACIILAHLSMLSSKTDIANFSPTMNQNPAFHYHSIDLSTSFCIEPLS
jgi:hypothetical protein